MTDYAEVPEKKENLWNKLLSEIRQQDFTSEDATLIVLGEKGAGKASLIRALEKISGEKLLLESRNDKSMVNIMKDKKLASVIDFFYLSIKNPDDENMELGKINIYFITEYADKKLIEHFLDKEKLMNLSVMVVLDFEKYWTAPDNIQKWLKFINEKIAPVRQQLELAESDRLKEKMNDLVKNYAEPFTTEDGKILNKKSEISPEQADNLIVPEGCLIPNYGFPIIFVINKCDHILEIKNQPNADEILEMIEYRLRSDLVSMTSPIIYTSTKMNINIELTFDYLKYIHYKLPFRHPSNINKEMLFVPIGLDNPSVIEASFASSSIKNKSFDDVMPRTEQKKENK